MARIFTGKNNKPYLISDLEIGNILKNSELLSMYSMKELDELYKKYFGAYTYTYPYVLSKKINIYDKSDEVNSFLIGDEKCWLDKATRVGLMNLANCSQGEMQLVLNDKIMTFNVDFVKDFLTRLEIYASQCYLQTQKHLTAVKSLKTAEDIINYDYTTGYPEKIVLE